MHSINKWGVESAGWGLGGYGQTPAWIVKKAGFSTHDWYFNQFLIDKHLWVTHYTLWWLKIKKFRRYYCSLFQISLEHYNLDYKIVNRHFSYFFRRNRTIFLHKYNQFLFSFGKKNEKNQSQNKINLFFKDVFFKLCSFFSLCLVHF